jgi:putative pyruvate formate lyase activating enzyme
LVDRNSTVGYCKATNQLNIAKYYLHPFEEPIISGKNGSGTIFFTGCSLKCVFCQNYDLSRVNRGKNISITELVDIFKRLEDMGAQNINFITPSHYAYQIGEALSIYKPSIPIVYNTHSYENLQTLKYLNDYIDIYLPDLKFYDSLVSKRYTNKEDYFSIASKNIEFMMNSKKTIIENSVMKSGVIVRHLILPMQSNDSLKIIDWFFNHQKNGAYLSIMSQYTPFGDIENFPELKRKITKREYDKVLTYIYDLNIENCFIQDLKSADTSFIPKWDY